jgi:hypothetical protein
MSLAVELPNIARERWQTAGRFADVLDTEVKSRQHSMVARVVSWLNFCRICQDLEEQMLLASAPSEGDMPIHRALLSTAMASGEGLLLEVEDSDALRAADITVAGLRARLESLRITFEQWHTELHPARQAAILEEAFGATV